MSFNSISTIYFIFSNKEVILKYDMIIDVFFSHFFFYKFIHLIRFNLIAYIFRAEI